MTALAFSDPVLELQAVFRRIMGAMAAPGTIVFCGEALAPPAALAPAAAAALLTLADFETPLWIAPSFGGEVAAYLTFHTGAPLAPQPGKAAFALIDLAADGLRLDHFAEGSAEYPDRSTTVVAQGASLCDGPALRLAGPGVEGETELRATPLPEDLLVQWRSNRGGFPLGVDLILAAGTKLACLPRSVVLSEERR